MGDRRDETPGEHELATDVELGAGWDACMTSLGRKAAQRGIEALTADGFQSPGDVEDRLGYHLGELSRKVAGDPDARAKEGMRHVRP